MSVKIDDNTKKSTAVYREMLYHVITKMKKKNREAAEAAKPSGAGC